MNVKLYVEGGGDSKLLRASCREAFSKLLEQAGFRGRMPRIVACGSRNETYADFCTALASARAQDYPIFLVDSEDLLRAYPKIRFQGWESLRPKQMGSAPPMKR